MVQIPQISRDRLASSVVGTPGVDTSSQQLFEAGAATGKEVGNAAFDMAIQQQQQRDTAEVNLRLTGYKENVTDTFEKAKETFANEPEKLLPFLHQQMTDQLTATQEQASNPRVKLAMGAAAQSDYFQGLMIRQSAEWAFKQREQVDKQGVLDGASKAVDDAGNVVADNKKTYDQKVESLLPIFSRIGNLTAGAFATAHPASATKFQKDTTEAAYKNIVGKFIDSNPIQAMAFLEEKHTKEVLSEGDRLSLKKTALQQVKNFQENQDFNQSIDLMAKNPQMMADVDSGKLGWSDLVKMDPDHKNPMISILEKNLLNSSPAARQQKDDVVLGLIQQAHELGVYGKVKGEELTPSKSVEKMINFQQNLEQNKPFMDDATYKMLHTKLAVPMSAAIMDAHKPNLWEQLKQAPGDLWNKVTGKPQEKVDQFGEGYDTINNFLKNTKQDTNVELKTRLLTSFIEQSHKVQSQNFLDQNGRQYTPTSLAHTVISPEFQEGKMWSSPIGIRKIIGWNGPGDPMIETNKEDDIRLAVLRKAAGGVKK